METPNINASFEPNNSDRLWKITSRNIFNILLILAYLLDKVRIYDLTRICFTWAFLKSIYFFHQILSVMMMLLVLSHRVVLFRCLRIWKNVQDLCFNMFNIWSHWIDDIFKLRIYLRLLVQHWLKLISKTFFILFC